MYGRSITIGRLLGALILAAVLGACTTTPTSPSALSGSGAYTVGAASSGPEAAPTTIIDAPPQALGATRFMAFGDSITAGVLSEIFEGMFLADEAGSYPTLLRNGLNHYHAPQAFTVFNEGSPGETARNGIDRLPGRLDQQRPQVLMLLEGINDLNFGASIEQTAANVHHMVQTARLFNCTVLLATMPQTYYSFDPGGPNRPPRERHNSTEKIVPYNNELKRLVAGMQNVHVVDLYAAFGNNRAFMGDDGLHPSPAGYQRMAETFYNSIRAVFPVRGSLQ